jgi:hypothetical protein
MVLNIKPFQTEFLSNLLLLKQNLDFIPDTAKENHKKGTVVVVETEQKNTQ